ncbi:MAG TPA: FtsW/RodA/SpoVE family cell cycle protein [Pseudobacteroides sp.]|uniref:FtsW/RodA/SpoVE family cell cycle protein n=1 Tax=Pseudobacteroides sp. TaxID=1968840 RepID=UPI002F93C3D7
MLKFLSLKRPVNMLVLANIVAFGLLYYYKKPYDKMVLIEGLVVTGLICLSYFFIAKKNMGDEYLFLVVSMLASLGVLMIYRLDQELGLKQILWLVVGIALFFVSYYIYGKIKTRDKLMFYYYSASMLLFVITLLIGSSINGSRNWIYIGGYSFQPSEIIKILFILTIACYFKSSEQLVVSFRDINIKYKIDKGKLLSKIAFFIMVYSFIGFLVLQKEWGTALLLFLIYFMILYTFDDDIKLLLLNGGAAAVGAAGGYFFVHHIKIRVDMWLNPWVDAAGKGYQITQSMFAIGAGGFFGRGIGLGNPHLIPEVKTDFIFSAICEEMGIFGGIAVILLYFLLVYRGFKIALYIKDLFKKLVAMGITLMFGFQTFIIIGGVIKFIPLTGITLPFISYGGSSLTSGFIALGILQALSKESYSGEEDIENE